MKIIVLHRISNKKLKYEQVLDHLENEVVYLCLGKFDPALPPYARCIVMPGNKFDEEFLIKEYEHLFRSADVLVARSEFDLIPGARLREHFGIEGEKVAHVLPYRNKLVMRRLAAKAGIVQPEFYSAGQFIEQEFLAGTFVLKPHSEAASNGIVMGGMTEIKEAISQLPDPSSYLVEHFTTGKIWHIDGWRHKGKVKGCVPSQYLGSCLEHASGIPLGSVQQPLTQSLLTLTQRILDSLGGADGSFHLELIESESGQFHFLEVASRVGGAGVAETFALRTGINLYHVDLRVALGMALPHDTLNELESFYGWFVYTPAIIPEKEIIESALKQLEPNLHSYTYNPNFTCIENQNSYSSEANLLTGVTVGSVEQNTEALVTLFKLCQFDGVAA